MLLGSKQSCLPTPLLFVSTSSVRWRGVGDARKGWIRAQTSSPRQSPERLIQTEIIFSKQGRVTPVLVSLLVCNSMALFKASRAARALPALLGGQGLSSRASTVAKASVQEPRPLHKASVQEPRPLHKASVQEPRPLHPWRKATSA